MTTNTARIAAIAEARRLLDAREDDAAIILIEEHCISEEELNGEA